MNTCPACSSALKSGLFSNNSQLTPQACQLINVVKNQSYEAYCNKCGDQLLVECLKTITIQMSDCKKQISEKIEVMPVVSIQNPFNWNYVTLGIVTAQSLTVFGDLYDGDQPLVPSFFTDHSEKVKRIIRKGETECFEQMRKDAIKKGGNAVIGVDIDYGELAGGRGMVMVSCTGTAVLVENSDVLGDGSRQALEEIKKIYEKLSDLQRAYNNYEKG